jgi:2'-5' RNA ligase
MSHGPTARLFVAADLPDAVRRELARWARAAAGSARSGGGHVRVLASETLHVTLCFLGSRPVGEIAAFARALEQLPVEPVEALSLGAPLWLPARRPRALAVELHDEAGALGTLQAELVRALQDTCGIEPERRRFRSHVTVARLRPGDAPHERALPATPDLSFAPVALTLYRSWLGPVAASYEALASCALGVAAVE